MNKMAKILLIEDEQALRQALQDALEYHGYSVITSADGVSGLNLAENENPDLVILDVMLPGLDGFEVCTRLRASGFRSPVLILTARSEEVDRVVGLELGADDYIVKPFSTRELMARVKAHLRRSSNLASSSPSRCSFGDVVVDFPGSTVTRGGKAIPLTSTELTILRLLVERKDEVVSRDQILNVVWGYESLPESRAVDTHIVNLRHKLEPNPGKPKYIITIHGLGYKFIG
ncbi:MAG: response regulator transcription factor [Bacteroidia bacterium]|nr:MAG: response regulator transcription factor [Bacteroidia bacterium]